MSPAVFAKGRKIKTRVIEKMITNVESYVEKVLADGFSIKNCNFFSKRVTRINYCGFLSKQLQEFFILKSESSGASKKISVNKQKKIGLTMILRRLLPRKFT